MSIINGKFVDNPSPPFNYSINGGLSGGGSHGLNGEQVLFQQRYPGLPLAVYEALRL